MTPPDPTIVLLVRHASTEHTAQRRVSGGGVDPSLSEAGRAEAERLKIMLLRSGRFRVVTSPAARARETAAAVGDDVVVDDGWREVGFGAWEGLTYAEIAQGWPEEFAAWQASPEVAPPGGESLLDVGTRVRRAWNDLIMRHPGETVVVLTHVAPIRTVLRGALVAGPEALWRLRVDPVSVSTVRVWPDGGVEVGGVNVSPS